ncbi:MAG: hypothetical protein JSS74_14210 [Actinobacteria bacterium]|nr:hypothetical protein [Actinomycetota bacterium]
MTDVKSGLSRRTLVKGAVWSVPIVAAAVAAPMASASPAVVGEFHESSIGIFEQSTVMSGIFVKCATPYVGAQAPWYGKEFTATITVSYVGSHSDFAFGQVTESGYWTVDKASTPTKIVLTAKATSYGCGQGAFRFQAINLSYSGATPTPEAGSIIVDGHAESTDGTFRVARLIDDTPCSPTFGSTPIGPRRIVGAVDGICPDGRPSGLPTY